MTDERMTQRGLLEKSPDVDACVICSALPPSARWLEVGLTGAGFGEKSPERVAQRNGYRGRD